MSINSKVIWSEGMFLQPHHFQQNDRHIHYLINKRSAVVGDYFWGIKSLKFDEQLLALGKLAIVECEGILPDGTVFNIPHLDSAPAPLEVPEGVTNSIIYFAIPLRRSGVPEVGIEQDSGTYRYQAELFEISDSNAGANQEAQIQIGKLSLRLLLEHENRTGYACVGVAKIKEARGDHTIILDDEFIPSCLDIQASKVIAGFIHELVSLLRYRGESLADRITSNKQDSSAEMMDFMLLQIVNRYEPQILNLSVTKSVHPAQLYEMLLGLMGELATFTTEIRRPLALANYQHDELQQTFQPLMAELRRSLSMVLEQNAIAIPIEERQYGIWVASVADKTLINEANFVLAVHADMAIEEIKKIFPVQTKIAPVEHIRALVTKGLPGIDLEAMSSAPRQIPYHTKFTYFILNSKHPYWNDLNKSGGIAFHIAGGFPGLKLELWAIRG